MARYTRSWPAILSVLLLPVLRQGLTWPNSILSLSHLVCVTEQGYICSFLSILTKFLTWLLSLLSRYSDTNITSWRKSCEYGFPFHNDGCAMGSTLCCSIARSMVNTYIVTVKVMKDDYCIETKEQTLTKIPLIQNCVTNVHKICTKIRNTLKKWFLGNLS